MTADSIKTAYPLIEAAIKAVDVSNPGIAFSVIVIGSAARGTETHRSDLDLLIVSATRLRLPKFTPPLHVQCGLVTELKEKVTHGDDFVAWAIRFGVPVKESDEWRLLTNLNEAATWPDWKRKVEHAATRLLLSVKLFHTGDIESATEEMIYAASHAARAILLERQVFPLSKAELPEQLGEIGLNRFGSVLSRLIHDDPDSVLLQQMMGYVKRLLCSMDRGRYSTVATAHRLRARQKKQPA